MKKLYAQLFAAFFTENPGLKAIKILLALLLSGASYHANAQVTVTPGSGGTLICSNTAANGTAPTCTTLGTITINETTNADFSLGAGTIVLNAPAGWQFCVAPAPVVVAAGGGDVTVTGSAITTSTLTINTNSTGTGLHDQITITGLKVQAILTTSGPGYIYASTATGVAGITTGPAGTDFGDLALIPTPITTTGFPFTVCTGNCVTFGSTPGGGVWSTSNPAIATVNPATGQVCGVSSGVATITYTVSGCSTTQNITVNSSPPPITGVHNVCAWFDSFAVHDAVPGGVFSSTLVTVVNSGLSDGNGEVYAHAPGIATVTYTLPTGCSATSTFTVYALPAPIMSPPYEICVGATKVFTDASPGGTWTSTVTGVATIGTSSGLATGIAPGTTKIVYTLSTGCKTDTTLLVDPVPNPITGTFEICLLTSTTLHNTTGGGTWSSTNTGVATIDPFTGIMTGVGVGTSTISYTLSTGCAATVVITVDALPGPISGPNTVCVNDSIQLIDGTPGGVWSSLNALIATVNPSTGWVRGVAPGVDTIKYTIMPGSCVATYVITVNPLPAPIIGPDSICVGSTGVETDATPGGTWSSSNTLILFIDPVGFITGVSGGVATITYTLSTGCFVTKNVTVNPVPVAISGPDSVCVFQTIGLTDATPGGVWSSSVPTVGTIDPVTGIFEGLSPGVTTVKYTIATGGCFASMDVTVNPVPPAIGGPSAVCLNDSVTATDALAGGTWSSSDPLIASVNPSTGVVFGVSVGSVNLTYSRGGCFVTEVFNVNDKRPILGPNQVCQGDSIILVDSAVGVGSTWISLYPTATVGTVTSLIASTAVIHGVAPGVDTIVYTIASTGCTVTFPMTVNPIAPISGLSTVCVGSSIDLSDIVPGGIWTSSDTFIAKIDSFTGHLTGTGPGNVTITYMMPTGCFATAVITVNPLPAPILGPNQVCVSDTIVLTDATLGGTWSTDSAAIANIGLTTSLGIATAQIFGVSAGNTVITYTIGSGCYVVDSITVNAKSPIFGPNQVCVGSTITLVDTTAGGTWTLGNGSAGISSVFDSSVTLSGLVAGVDTVYYTIIATDCQSMYVITVNPLPANITGPDSVCVGQNITLVDTPGIAPFGTWTSSAPGVAAVGSSFDSSAIITGISSGVATITYTLSTGCLATKTITVHPSPSPIVGPSFVCLGRHITLSDPTPGGVWTSSNVAVATIGSTGFVSTLSLGTTVISYTLPIGGCASALVVTVTPIPVITVTPAPAGMICKGASTTLTASGAGTPGGTSGTYSWSPSYALSSTFGAVVVASPTVTTTYTVVGTTMYGCDSFTTFTVIVDSALNHLKITGKDSVCDGECDTLIASGEPASLFAWHPIAGLSRTIGDTVVACTDVTTKYTAVAIDYIGCKDSVSFTVTVNPIPKIVIDKNPIIICRGLPVQAYVWTTNTDTTKTLFTWTPNLFISCDTCYNPIFTDTFNLVYRVIATSQYGCYDSMTVKVNVLDTNYNTINRDTNICIGTSAQLRAYSHSLTGNLDIPTYTWFPTTGLNNANIYNPVATPNVTTTYSVAIHENACFDDTLSTTVFVEPLPVITITPGSITVVAGTPVQLQAIVTNVQVATYAWTPAATLSCDSCFNPVAIPTATSTTYTVIVTSIYGCQSTDTISIRLFCDQSEVFVPNTFTPNGDGVNDRFFVSSKGITLITKFLVYNRWGQLLFEAYNIPPNDPAYGWDGTFKGVVLEPDVFVYVVDAICEFGTPFNYKGDISIVK